jgi:hypothetical protein
MEEIIYLTERTTYSDADHTTLHKLLAQTLELLNNSIENGVSPGDQAQFDEIWAEIERIWEAIANIELIPGPPGETFKPMGVVPTPNDLPPDPDHLSVFVDQETSHVWVYDPNSPAAGENGYVDMGQIGGMGSTPVPQQDSGWRDVSSLVDSAWLFDESVSGLRPGVYIRRSGNMVTLRLDSLHVLEDAESPLLLHLPAGFGHPLTWGSSFPMVTSGGIGGAALDVYDDRVAVRSVNLTEPSARYAGQFVWMCDEEFPLVLPGVDVA